MKVDTSLNTAILSGLTNASRESTSDSFQNSLNKALADLTSSAGTQTQGPAKVTTQADKAKTAQAADEATLAEFREYMSKTPEQRMREAILKEMGLTEEDLKAMPPEQRQAVEASIAEKIKDRMQAQQQEKASAIAARMTAGGSAGLLLLSAM